MQTYFLLATPGIPVKTIEPATHRAHRQQPLLSDDLRRVTASVSMNGNTTTIAGIPLPSDAPLFLAFIAVHIAAGLTAIIAGAIAMLSRKQPGRHPQAGTVYYWALAVIFVTMSPLSLSRWSEDYRLFILGVLSFVAATIGRTARRRPWQSWARIHMTGMGGSYIILLTAFCVVNGPNLPLLRFLPPVAFWLLPTLIGAPILVYALLRHPWVRPRSSN